MTSYPGSIYSPREKDNRSGVVYDATKKTVIFAEDIENDDNEIVAIETELGTAPKGTFASVAAFLANLLGHVSLSKNLVVYFPLSFSSVVHISDALGIKDGSIVRNDAQNAGAVLAPVDGPDNNGAFDFDGVDDYILIPHCINQLLVAGFTFSVWIKPDTGGESTGRILDKSSGSSGNDGFRFYVQEGVGTLNYAAITVNAGTGRNSGIDSIVIGSGIWYHVVVTVASDGMATFYINGVQKGTPGLTGAPSGITTANAMRIGNRAEATDRTFDGKIAKVRVYSRVLDVNEIAVLYNCKL